MNTIKKALGIFTLRQKFKLVYLTIIILIGSLCELVGVTAIIPFINVALDPKSIQENAYMNEIYTILNLRTAEEFLIILGVFLIIVYVVKNIFITYMNNAIYRFTYRSQRDLATNLLILYMGQPYTYFLKHNSADLVRNLNQDTVYFFETVLASLQLIAELSVCAMLGVYLIYSDPTISVSVVFIMVIFSATVFRTIKNNLEKKGLECRAYRGDMNKWVMQSAGGIKEIKILGNANFFKEEYQAVYKVYAENYRVYKMLAFIPRTLMESLCVCSLLGVVIYKIYIGTAIGYFIPTLTVFALAAFRLLPSFNRITAYISQIMFNKSSVDAIYSDLQEMRVIDNILANECEQVSYRKNIDIKNISFSYPDSDDKVLDKVSLSIPKSKAIAFIGPSGSGKTTLADILLGILEPQEGDIFVDGEKIDVSLRNWKMNLGYIPQSIFLMDDTLCNNIALGVKPDQINQERLMDAIKGAQLKSFIDTLPEGIGTIIGESGVRLSGGQRQRIGIARALYTNPDILILDEATSALDNDTEEAVMGAIDRLAGTKTLIIIAHRLSTIQNCDVIYEIKDKKVSRVLDKL